MSSSRSLAAAQTVPVRGDVATNTRRHLDLVDAAAGEDVQLLVFPELSLTGYELDLAPALAFTEDDARLDPLRARAASGGVTLVVGAPVRSGEKLHIGAFVLCPDGHLGLTTKRRLGAFPPEVNPGGAVPPPEPSVFCPGERDELVRIDEHFASIAICADTGDAEHPLRAARRGARSYLASMFFTPGELRAEEERLRGYAIQHSLAVVLANYGGPTGGLPSAGHSAIWSQSGELLAQLPESGPGLAIACEDEERWSGRTRLP